MRRRTVINIRSWCFTAAGVGVMLSSFAANGQERVKLGLLPFSELLAAVIADKQGFFKEEGLDVDSSKFESGALAVPLLQSGRLDVVLSNTVTTFQAIAQGLDGVVLAPGAVVRELPPDGAIIAKKGSIASAKALEGKRIAVNVINSTSWLHTVAWLQKYGVERAHVRFVEVPFPQMNERS